jgi:tetratricopeptide (TPR) repeat protein
MDPADAAAIKERVLAERQRRADEAAAEEERLRLEAAEKLRLKHLRFHDLPEGHKQKEQAEADTMLALARARAAKAEELLAQADAAHLSLMPKEGASLEAESKAVRVQAVETFVAVVLIAQESGDQTLEAAAYQHMALLRVSMAHWAERVAQAWAETRPDGKPLTGADRKEVRRRAAAQLGEVKLEMAVQLVAARAALEAARACYAAAGVVPGEAAAALSLGGVCMRLGDEAAALEALQSALELYQGDRAAPEGGPDEHAVDVTLNTLRMIMVRQGTMALYGRGTWIEREEEEEAEEEAAEGKEGDEGAKVPALRGGGEVVPSAVGAAVGSAADVAAAKAELARRPSNGAVPSSASLASHGGGGGGGGSGGGGLTEEERLERRAKAKEANTLYVLANMRWADAQSFGYEQEAERARCSFEAARALYAEVGNVRAEANCMQLVGSCLLRLSQARECEGQGSGGYVDYHHLGDAHCEGTLEETTASGECRELLWRAIEALLEAVALFEACGARLGLAHTLSALGAVRIALGGFEQRAMAEQEVARAVGEYAALEDWGNEGNAQATLRWLRAWGIAHGTSERAQDEFEQMRADKKHARQSKRKEYLAQKKARERKANGGKGKGKGRGRGRGRGRGGGGGDDGGEHHSGEDDEGAHHDDGDDEEEKHHSGDDDEEAEEAKE